MSKKFTIRAELSPKIGDFTAKLAERPPEGPTRNKWDTEFARNFSGSGIDIKAENGKIEFKIDGNPFEINGKSPENFVNDIKLNVLDGIKKTDIKGVDNLKAEYKKIANDIGRNAYNGLYPPENFVNSVAKNLEDGMKPDIEKQAQILKNPELVNLKDIDINKLPDVPNPKDVPEAEFRSSVDEASKNKNIEKIQSELTKGIDSAKVDNLAKDPAKVEKTVDDLEAKSTSENGKSWWQENGPLLKKALGIGLAGLAVFFTYDYLKSVADEKTGCFLTRVDAKGKATTYKIRGLSCKKYRNTGKLQTTERYKTDCKAEQPSPPSSGGSSCGTCQAVMLSSAYPFTNDCPCPDENNIASKFCSNEYMIETTDSGSVKLKYYSQECTMADALVDTASRLREFVQELGGGIFGDFWDTIMTYLKYAVIFIGIFIVIYVLIWLANKFGFFGKKKELPMQPQYQEYQEYQEYQQYPEYPEYTQKQVRMQPRQEIISEVPVQTQEYQDYQQYQEPVQTQEYQEPVQIQPSQERVSDVPVQPQQVRLPRPLPVIPIQKEEIQSPPQIPEVKDVKRIPRPLPVIPQQEMVESQQKPEIYSSSSSSVQTPTPRPLTNPLFLAQIQKAREKGLRDIKKTPPPVTQNIVKSPVAVLTPGILEKQKGTLKPLKPLKPVSAPQKNVEEGSRRTISPDMLRNAIGKLKSPSKDDGKYDDVPSQPVLQKQTTVQPSVDYKKAGEYVEQRQAITQRTQGKVEHRPDVTEEEWKFRYISRRKGNRKSRRILY
jgi:hypothetical protein